MKDLVRLLSRRPKASCAATDVAAGGTEPVPTCADDYTTGFTANDRLKLVADIRYYAAGSLTTMYGQVLDLSSSGAKVWIPSKVPTEESVKIRIQASELGLIIERAAFVCWLGFKDHGDWNVGLAFQEKIAEKTLLNLADNGYLERRSEPRQEMSRLARIRRGNDAEQGTDVLLEDLSEGGFCIRSPWPLEPGQRLVLDVSCDGDLTMTLPAEVRWKKAVDDGYSIGCRFTPGDRRVGFGAF